MIYVLKSTILMLCVCFCTMADAQELTLTCPDDFEKSELDPLPNGAPLYGIAVIQLPEASSDCRRPGISYTWLVDGVFIPIDPNALPSVEGFTTHEIVIMASDACGSNATCSYTITITRPELEFDFTNCPMDTSIYVLADATGAMVEYNAPSFQSNCPLPTTFSFPLPAQESGSVFPLGTTQIAYTAFNEDCGEATCVFDINVEVASLSIECPESFTKAEEFPDDPRDGFGEAVIIFPDATTNCPISSGVTVTLLDVENYSLSSNNEFIVEGFQTHLIEFAVSDACGNLDTCAYEITITRPEVETGFVNCPTDTIIIELDRFQTSAVVEYETPEVFSNCFFDFELLADQNNKGSGSTFFPGFYTENFTLNAPCGGASCSIFIDVRYEAGPLVEFVDCPADFTKAETSPIDPMNDPFYGLARIEVPELFSACEFGANTILLEPLNTVQINGEDYVSGFGTYEVLFIGVGNGCGVIDSCAYTITIERPEIQFEFENCPVDTIINLEVGETGVVFEYDFPRLVTNCEGDGIITSDPDNIGSGGTFPLGISTERFVASGECGEIVCEFVVNVQAKSANLTVNCPESFTKMETSIPIRQADYGIAIIAEPEAFTDCLDPAVSIELLTEDIIFFESQPAVSGFRQHDITFRISDNCGNVQVCTYTIDVTRPDFVYGIGACPTDIFITVPAGSGGGIVEFDEPQVAGNCPDENISLTRLPFGAPQSGEFFPVGTTTLTYVYSSIFCGNVSCEFNIIVEEAEVEENEGVDLELSLSTDAIELPRYNAGDFLFTLQNKGTEVATEIEVLLDFQPNIIVPVGSAIPQTSKGIYRPVLQTWMIDELAAGESATLNIRMFANIAGAFFFTQVSAMAQEDIDSVPNNGNCCMANEDDEVYFEATVVEPAFIVNCPENAVKMDALPFSLDDEELFGKAVIQFPKSFSSIAGGDSATLQVPLYVAENQTATIYGQILIQNEADNDSAPGNGQCCLTNEDDEATFTSRGELIPDYAARPNANGDSMMQAHVYPNPAQTRLELTYPVGFVSRSYLIFDLNGRLVQRGDLQAETTQTRIDISSLQKGLYWLKIDGEEPIQSLRFVKL